MKTTLLTALVLSSSLLSGCLDKDKIATVPDAENQLFTPDGRLVVTGGTGVFEIVRSGSGYAAQAIAADVSGVCNYTGLAQLGSWVFTACQQHPSGLFGPADNHLLAAQVVAGQPLHFVQVDRATPDPMDTLSLPNGLAATPDGRLLVADYNLLASAGLARVTLDLSGARPRVTAFQANWVNASHGISHPNGVRVQGNELFVSDVSFVKRFAFDAAGNVPVTLPNGVKNEALVYQGATVLDDILPLCGGVAIDDFLNGRVIYMAPAGNGANGLPTWRQAYASPWQQLAGPSSVRVGRAPLFSGRDVLVTEKGILLEMDSDYGNKLSRVQASLDLSDPASCAVINAQ